MYFTVDTWALGIGPTSTADVTLTETHLKTLQGLMVLPKIQAEDQLQAGLRLKMARTGTVIVEL